MYTVTKNTKLTSLVLMLIGVVALGYGFIQGAGHHSDEEVSHQVEAFAHDLQSRSIFEFKIFIFYTKNFQRILSQAWL